MLPRRDRPTRICVNANGRRQFASSVRLFHVFFSEGVLCLKRHRSCTMHSGQFGFRALQVYRPCRISQWWASFRNFSGTAFSSFSSTCKGVLPGARPVRFETRKICVSTAMVGSPKAVLSTTLAVFLPTPGKASSAARSSGTSELCSSTNILQVLIIFLALVLNKPMVLIYFFKPLSFNAAIFFGVGAFLNKASVALFTPLSVDCAERITAISNSKGDEKFNSVVGLGICFLRMRNHLLMRKK